MQLLSILVTALVPMVLGLVWYHPKVFGAAWMRLSGITEEKAKQGNMALKFGLSYLFSVMIAFVLSGAIVVHDGFVKGALYFMTNRGTVEPQPGSDAAKWLDYYNTVLAASNHTFTHGSFHGFFLIGLFIVLPVFATNAIFERKSFKYVVLIAGYWIIAIAIMGGILAVWR